MEKRFRPRFDFERHDPLFIQVIQDFIKQAVRQQLAIFTGRHIPELLQPFDHLMRMHQFQCDPLPVGNMCFPMGDLTLMVIFLPVVFHILNFTVLEQHQIVFQRPAMTRNVDPFLFFKVGLVFAIQSIKMGLYRQISHKFDRFRFDFQSVYHTGKIGLDFISKNRIPLTITLAAFRMTIA